VTANVARSKDEAETQARLGRALVGEEDQLDSTPKAVELLEQEALEAIEAEASEESDDSGEDAAETSSDGTEEEKSA
jgi:hypothetical protein